MAFQKGHSFSKGFGRPKATSHSVAGSTKEVREFARRLVSDVAYRRKLRSDLKERKLEPALEQMLWHYAHGKPREAMEAEWDLTRLSDHELAQLEALIERAS